MCRLSDRSSRVGMLFFLIALLLLAGGAPSEAKTEKLSRQSLAYARELGGTPQKGKVLFLLVGATASSEKEAQKILDEAIPFFGDMQSYFIIQHANNFKGLKIKGWILIEAYLKTPAQENLDFAHRAFSQISVEEVIVLTEDPIPVYETLVGE